MWVDRTDWAEEGGSPGHEDALQVNTLCQDEEGLVQNSKWAVGTGGPAEAPRKQGCGRSGSPTTEFLLPLSEEF